MNLKVAIAQIKIQDGNKEKNLDNALSILNFLKNQQIIPDIVCFPELFTTGYDLENLKMHAEEFPGETFHKIISISKNNFIVIGSIIESKNNKYFNTAFILGKNGQLLGKYRKVHLFSPMFEKDFLTQGNSIGTFKILELKNIKIGLGICYDLRFPEIFRKMALNGAKLIILPSEFPIPKSEIWKTLIKARAIENQIYMIGVNRVGKGRSNSFFGNSMVTNGNTHQILGSTEEIRIFNLDLTSLKEIRGELPLLNDRRKDLYD
ncbi:MAG: carbon-nitrogen family hydrolase [Candidatus Lokiarchaeota archaeon]|nr:carbon-nitrogen family hydrolase [Candidatus Lokiarchaeota archaeon]